MRSKDEIGGYFGFETGVGSVYHDNAVKLNSGCACLSYYLKTKRVESLWVPDYICDSIQQTCVKEGVRVRGYHIGLDLQPIWDFVPDDGDHLYLVDYFGQLKDDSIEMSSRLFDDKIILDLTENFFQKPPRKFDALYSVRKWFGTPDGAFLYTNEPFPQEMWRSRSLESVGYLFGRVEKNAREYHSEFRQHEELIRKQEMMRISRTSEAILRSIDYNHVLVSRNRNYAILKRALDSYNLLKLHSVQGPFAYPLLVEDASSIREELASRGIFIPTLWPRLLNSPDVGDDARTLAKNILPLPVDQRYMPGDMLDILDALRDVGLIPYELEGKKLAILGGIRASIQIVDAAKALGVHTTVIDYNTVEESPAKNVSDENSILSVADAELIADYIREHEIDGIITGYTDSILGFYANACEVSGLPCYGTKEQFNIFTNKDKWKALCKEFGVPVAKGYTTDRVINKYDEPNYPVLVKPADGSGARGTSVANDFKELKQAYENALTFSKTGQVIIEDYLEGPEVTVFWLFIDGIYHVYMIGNRLVKKVQDDTIPLPAGYTFPSVVIPRYLTEVAPKVKEMLASLSVRNGMMFMQCIVKDGIPHVYDIGYRLTGSFEHHMLRQIAGISPMDMLIRFAVTGKMCEDEDIEKKISQGLYSPCFNVSRLFKPGKIGAFSIESDVPTMPEVIHMCGNHGIGDVLPMEGKGELRQIGYRVLGAVNHIQELQDVMLDIQSKIKILSLDGEDLTLGGLEPQDFVGNLIDSNGLRV